MKNVEKANALEPRDAALEAAATAYAKAVARLEPLLKEADDYYTQQNYKDDKMAKGKALHPLSRRRLGCVRERRQERCAAASKPSTTNARWRSSPRSSKAKARKARYHVEALMIQAKRVLRAEDATKPDLAAITQALERLRKHRQGDRGIFRRRRRRQDRLDVHQQRQVVPDHGEGS